MTIDDGRGSYAANNGPDRLKQIAVSLRNGEVVPEETVRSFLSWFGAKRRGYRVAASIRDALESEGLTTSPDFESVFIDSPVRILLQPITGSVDVQMEPPTATVHITASASGSSTASLTLTAASARRPDPTYRLSRLQAANRRPVFVRPDNELRTAVTLMLQHDYSQLPVMTNEREVKGVISWKSVGARLATGKSAGVVKDFLDDEVLILDAAASFFDAFRAIVEKEFVLVRAIDRTIVGIVTTTDLSSQFLLLTEPFLLLAEIENDLRRIIDSKFSQEELCAAKDARDGARTVSRVDDLTFGEYVRLLENPDNWLRVSTGLDRKIFVEGLQQTQRTRNDVMHFDPDGIDSEDLGQLRTFANFMRRLRTMGAT